MDLSQLSYFVRVADAGGFSLASAQLALTQSTVSRQVALLEEELGQRLFNRTGRGVTLTEAGRTFLRYAQSMLDTNQQAREALEDLQSSPRGRVTIGLPPRIANRIVPQLVQDFRDKLPNATIVVSEGQSHNLRELLIADRLQLAMLFDPPPSAQLHYEELATDELLFIAPTYYQLRSDVHIYDQLSSWDFILQSHPHSIRALIDAAAQVRKLKLNVVAEVDSVRSVMALVMRGVGCTVMPSSVLSDEARQLGLKVASLGSPPIISRLVLATPSHGKDSALLRETRKLLKTVMEQMWADVQRIEKQ